jgi:hypothetical protein
MKGTIGLGLGLAAASIGCGSAPVVARVPVTADPVASPPPTRPRQVEAPLVSEDGLVRVPKPRGEGWSCRADHVERPEMRFRATLVKCARRTPNGPVSLMAKDYEVPAEDVLSAEVLVMREYPKHYRKRYSRVRYTRSGPVEHQGHMGFEVAIELGREGGETTRVVERVVVEGTHVINVSVDVPAESFSTFESEVRRWFDGAEFSSLSVDRGPRAANPFAPTTGDDRARGQLL